MEYKNVYFLGIGGIGMSALARYFLHGGYAVAGYDRTPSHLTGELEAEGAAVHYEDDVRLIPEGFLDPKKTMVVYTPAVPQDHGEYRYFREHGFCVEKRSQMLGHLAEGKYVMAVAGTHGKTTTSTMVAWLNRALTGGGSAFLGGISKNFGGNLVLGDGGRLAVEADEFDRSFLRLYPDVAVVTSADADHLDIYGDLEHVHQAFREFASQVSETLILKLGLPIAPADVQARIFSYHFDDPAADFHSANLRLDDSGHYIYDLVYPGGTLSDIRVGAIGWVNVENSIAAAAACLCYGMDAQKVRHAVASFEGVRRRLDVHVNRPGLCYIDDYAHHPAELRSAISSVRQVFPGRKITGVFQPHLYTRTRDFAPEFAEALSLLDKLVLLDIYPAREEPIEGVSSALIFKDVNCPEKVMITKSELMDFLADEDIDVLMTLGAGDIDRFVPQITEMLEKR